MREIKFRAWNKVSKLIAYGVENEYDTIRGIRYSKNGKKLDDMEPGESSFGDYLSNENYIVMQYTGLKDKNGKEIWEGDIVRYPRATEVVVFKDSGFSPFSIAGWEFVAYDYESEVLGNIYENPELLKEQI